MDSWSNLGLGVGGWAWRACDRSRNEFRAGVIRINPKNIWFMIGMVLAARVLGAEPSSFGMDWQDPEYLIQTWETEHGLPENSATAMVQTPDGYLWFGTFNGLVRFDGVRFEVFDDINTPGLPGSSVVNLFLDSHERLWVSTLQGLAVRDRHGWRTLGEAEGWMGNYARTIAGRDGGEILITTFDHRTLEYVDGRFRELPAPHGVLRGSFGAVDGAGRWWVGQEGFVGYWDENDGWTSPAGVPEVLTGVACFGARDGGVWIVTGEGIFKCDGETISKRFEPPDLTGSLWNLYEDSLGNLWLSTHDRGLFRVSADGRVRQWQVGSGLASNGVRFVFEDHEGSLWVGASGGGISRFTARRVHTYGEEHGLALRVTNTIWTDRAGGVLVGTYGGGLFRLANGAARRIELPSGSDYIQSVVTDRAGRIWVGTFAHGLMIVDSDGVQEVASELTGGNNVIAQFEDSRGRMWVSGGTTIAVYEHERWKSFGDQSDTALYGTRAFAEDSQGRIWAASEAGLFRLEADRFTEIPAPDGGSISGVICLHADANGSMWIGSRSQGLARWRDGALVRVTNSFGTDLRSVGSVTVDERGYTWLTTNLGLLRVRHEDLESAANGAAARLRYQVLGIRDGLVTTAFAGGRQPVAAVGDDGRLWFATTKGIASVHPDHFRANTIAPRVEIRTVQPMSLRPSRGEFGSTTEVLDVASDSVPPRGLSFAPGVRRVKVEFTALSFVDPAKVRFEVMIEGLDAIWRDVGDRREYALDDLRPGRYVFRVRASNNDGFWNDDGASVAFRIEPFVWQTLWFRIGVVALAALGIACGVWRLGTVRQSRRLRESERFRLVVESSPSSILMVDQRGLISLVNAQVEQDFGYSREELIGSRLEVLIPERLRSAHLALRDEYMDAPQPRSQHARRDLVGMRRDGTEFPIEIGLTPIETDDGFMIMASIVNTSDRKRVEIEQARQRSEMAHLSRLSMLGELSGSLAHELNQPLTAILSNTQAAQRFLSRNPPEIDEVNEILRDIVDESRHAGDVIHGLRLLIKKGEIDKSPLDIGELVRSALRLVRGDLVMHGVTASTIIEPSLPSVFGSQAQLQQVVLNLMMNASDAMAVKPPGERKLTISARREEGGGVRLSVIDCGPGIPVEQHQLVFQPFFTTKETGIGLGLAVCRTIISAHGGTLWVEDAPGGGSAFHMILPSVETQD